MKNIKGFFSFFFVFFNFVIKNICFIFKFSKKKKKEIDGRIQQNETQSKNLDF